jgi:hypothetical protein
MRPGASHPVLATFRNAEYVRLAGSKVEEVDVYFGATLEQG